MTALPEGRRGLRAFTLSEVPEPLRLAAYDRLLRLEDAIALLDPGALADRAALGVAAYHPSARVYWIPREAWEKAMRRVKR